MRRNSVIRGIVAGGALTAAAAIGSQVPEIMSCFDSEGNNRTEIIGGDVVMPHCDDEFMSETALNAHNGLKTLTISLGIMTTSMLVGLYLGDRQEALVT